MKSPIKVYLFGSFQKGIGDADDPPIQLDFEEPTAIAEVIKSLNIPSDIVQLAMVNHRAVPKDSAIHPGDRLSLFSREYPIFADWKDLR
jgi:sulfur carrier protein ThiS